MSQMGFDSGNNWVQPQDMFDFYGFLVSSFDL